MNTTDGSKNSDNNNSVQTSSPTDSSKNLRYLQELMQELQTMTDVYEKTNSANFRNSYNLLLREIQRVWSNELGANDSLSTSQLVVPSELQTSPKAKLKSCGDENTPKRFNKEREATDNNCELSSKVYFPEEDESNSNLVGRIIGPRGMTIRQLEKDFDCSLYIRGKGCMRDEEKEKKLKGRPGWSHLDDHLHVLITSRGNSMKGCEEKLNLAKTRIEELLHNPNDAIKRCQLVQLAVIEGTLRE